MAFNYRLLTAWSATYPPPTSPPNMLQEKRLALNERDFQTNQRKNRSPFPTIGTFDKTVRTKTPSYIMRNQQGRVIDHSRLFRQNPT